MIIIALIGFVIVKMLYVPKKDSDYGYSEKYYENPLVDTYTRYEYNYTEPLKGEPSDIVGMSKYDKYAMGLSIQDGSDTDGDGLTDKEEIEVYGSDPLKKSTSGDLYDDG